MDPLGFWPSLGFVSESDLLQAANGLLEDPLVCANASILEGILWNEVDSYNAAEPSAVPAASYTTADVSTSTSTPAPSPHSISISSASAPAPDDHTLALKFASDHPGEYHRYYFNGC